MTPIQTMTLSSRTHTHIPISSYSLAPTNPSVSLSLSLSLSLSVSLSPLPSLSVLAMSSKRLLRMIFTANAGCGGGGCGRPKPRDVYEPTPIPKTSKTPKIVINQCSSPSNGGSISIDEEEEEDNGTSTTTTTTTISFNNADNTTSTTQISEHDETDPRPPSKNMLTPSLLCPKITNSIAIVKDSNDPYQDFRNSMLQMIFEREIYCREDLQDLLKCFLELNSPCFHDVIVEAFTEIWNQIVSKTPHPVCMGRKDELAMCDSSSSSSS